MEHLRQFEKQLSAFLFPEDVPEASDMIFVPGNGYPQMAERAADLWRAGYAPYVLPSGKYSVTEGHFSGVLDKADRYGGVYGTEWEFLRHVLEENGVPPEAILREDRATYTYENALFSREVLLRAGIHVRKAILCCKNYHARRCLMYYRHVFPDVEFLVCPVQADGISRDNWTDTEAGVDGVLGELERIIRQFHFLMKPPV